MIDYHGQQRRREEAREKKRERERERERKRKRKVRISLADRPLGPVTNDSVFRHSERYSGSHVRKKKRSSITLRPGLGPSLSFSLSLGVAAEFAWQLFVKRLSRCNVIDGGRRWHARIT